MTKLTLTLVADDDAAALRVLRRAFAGINFDHIGENKADIHLNTAGYTGSWDDGNYICDVARFEPVCGSEAEVQRLARAFTEQVKEYFGDGFVADGLDSIILRNRTEPNPSICHTHDFCDANMLMSNAWEECFPHEAFCLQNTFHTELWSAAWQQAKAAEFSNLQPSHDHAS
jgi:hypothetical protein